MFAGSSDLVRSFAEFMATALLSDDIYAWPAKEPLAVNTLLHSSPPRFSLTHPSRPFLLNFRARKDRLAPSRCHMLDPDRPNRHRVKSTG